MLFKFFKPKWQSPKSETRLHAVEVADSQADAEMLIELATRDQNSSVREAAIAKLNDKTLLVRLCDATHQRQRLAAQKRLCHLLSTANQFSKDEAHYLRQIQQQELLTHIVLNGSLLELQQSALEQLDDPLSLATVVRISNLAALRRAAASRLRDTELLEQLAKETLSKDKGINRILRNNLSELQAQQLELEQALSASAELATQLSQHANVLDDSSHVAAQTQLLRQKLQAHQWLPEAAASQQQAEQAWAKIEAHSDALAQAKADQQRALKEAAAKQQADIELAQALVKTGTALQVTLLESLSPSTHLQDFAVLEESVASLPKQVQSKYSLALLVNQTADLISAITRLQDSTEVAEVHLTPAAEPLSEPALRKAIKSITRTQDDIAWPKDMAEPELLRRLSNQKVQFESDLKVFQQASKEAQGTINTQIKDVEEAIASGQSKHAEKLYKRLEQQQAANALTQSQAQQLKALGDQLNELRDWAGFAAAPKKQTLCEQMEALAGSTLAPEELAKEIQQLQREWKLVDATDTVHSHTVWKRFKRAADEAYAPCEAYFNEQKSSRLKNLARRQQICELLEQHIAAFDEDTVDWRALAETLKRAKRNWKDAAPVDRSPGKKLQSRFDKLLPQLEGPLKIYRDNNAEQKLTLVAQIEALLKTDITPDTLEEVKHLQQVWRDIGPSYRNREQQMWPKFRDGCNAIFDSFHGQRKASNEQLQQHIRDTEYLCQDLEKAVHVLTGYTQLNTLLDKAEELHALVYTELSATLEKRFSHAMHLAQAQRKKLLAVQGSDNPDLHRRALLCDQFEATFTSDAHQAEERDELVGAWQQGNKAHPKLDERFSNLLNLQDANEAAVITFIESQATPMRQLCIRLEIALGQESPANDQALRMEYQLERLQQALAQQGEVPDLDTVLNIQYVWLGTSFRAHHPELTGRFNNLLEMLR